MDNARRRDAPYAAVPDAGLNLDHVEYRDFPMYELRLTMAETSFFGGKVKIVGLVFDAFGAFAETPPPSSAEVGWCKLTSG